VSERLRFQGQPERLPPHNLEAEAAVLGSVLLDRAVILRVRDLVRPTDFYLERNEIIFRAMVALDDRGEPVDYLTLIDELDRSRALLAAGGTTYVADFLGAVPTPIHAESYARLIAVMAAARQIMSIGGTIATMGFANQLEIEQMLERAEQLLSEVRAPLAGDRLVSQEQALQAELERLGAQISPERRSLTESGILPTTFKDLDRLLDGGFTRGELVYLAGRPGSGKSSLVLSLITDSLLAFGDLKAAFFSLEMSTGAMLRRQLSGQSGVPLTKFRQGGLSEAQSQSLGRALGQLANLQIWWDDSRTQTVASIKSRARRLSATVGGLDFVVIDHIQRMTGLGENAVARMSAISNGLAALAAELNVVVIALCQLNRSVEQRADKRLLMSDLRESGTLEQDADVILMLSREKMYKPDTEKGDLADLQVEKNRNGQTGDITLPWNPETTRFRGVEFYLDGRI